MRSLVYYVATSVDGFIAQKDGSAQGFLTEGDHLGDLFDTYPETLPTHLRPLLGIDSENRMFDTVLIGRATYEVGLREDITSPYGHLRQVLFSRSTQTSPHKDIELVRKNVLAFVKGLKQEKGKAIWLCGGGSLASALLPEIDELVLKINPFVMGRGIPVFAADAAQTALDLVNSKRYSSGVALQRYRVHHERSG